MNKYLLDTDICLFFLKNKFGITEKIEDVIITNCFVSEITIAELTFGAYKSAQFSKHIAEVVEVEELFGIIPIYNSYAKYAEEKVRLKKAGMLIPDFDLLIGTTAVINNMTMVTNNEKHFSRINGIKIENWTQAKYNQFVI